uniref:BPTI/Kunitz inhibitor domain-containing protein n=1 Tax=Xenopus tropicalis TaxID=8364 RepID=A0A803JCZ1_XENTR
MPAALLSWVTCVCSWFIFADNCLLDVNHGTACRGYQRMWYYIKSIDACSQFWYGGCDGNGNRFSSETECLQTCSSKSKFMVPTG